MKQLIIILLLLLSVGSFAQIADTWDAVKVGGTDISQIYVGASLVWEKPTSATPPSIVGTTSKNTTSTAVSSGVHSYTEVGDIILAYVASGSTNATISAPSGWTELYSYGGASTYTAFSVFYKIASTSDLSATFNFSCTENSKLLLYLISIEGKTSAPYIGYTHSTYQFNSDYDTDVLNGYYESDYENSIVITFVQTNSFTTITASSGYTPFSGTSSTGLSTRMYYKQSTSVGGNTLTLSLSDACNVTKYSIEILPIQ